ncbi:MAG: phosphotransferase [Acidimicrobiia bacterium]|nr:phosphotransferase [Acidimicrobiia bacterium]
MKPWELLTERGKYRRLRSLAMAALQSYAIDVRRLSFVGGFTNAIYRVDAAQGSYAIRIDYMQDHTDENAQVELEWVAALGAETELDVCHVVPARDGRHSVYAGAPGVPGERRCVLFEWIPGKPLAEDLTPERYHQLGVLSAQLHLHGAHFEPSIRPMPWDQVFYWPEEFDPVVYNLPKSARHFGGNRTAVMEKALATAARAFARLDPADAQVLHGDLHPWNVHVKGKRMIALDFEDVMWGDRVQDVAITLFYERDHDAYADLRAAFTEGYSAIAPWPEHYEGEVEHFMAARTLMFVNFILNIGSDVDEFYPVFFRRLEGFLEAWA